MRSRSKLGSIDRFAASGFSLVEVVLALGVVSFAMVGIMGLLPVGLTTYRQTVDIAVQSQIAQQIISDAQLTEFAQLKDYQVSFDGTGTEVSPQSPFRIYDVEVKAVPLPNSLTATFKEGVAVDLQVRIANIRSPGDPQVFSSIVIKND